MTKEKEIEEENICSLCKENLEGSQVLCWNCLCDIKDKVRKETQKDILEIIKKKRKKINKSLDGYLKEAKKNNFRKKYSEEQASKMLAIMDEFKELTQKINSQEPKTSDTTGTTTPDTQKIKEMK